jgi:hypothetical protein
MPNRSPISLSVLLVGINRKIRKASVTCGDTRTLKFTLIVQGMPMSGSCQLHDLQTSRSPLRINVLHAQQMILSMGTSFD